MTMAHGAISCPSPVISRSAFMPHYRIKQEDTKNYKYYSFCLLFPIGTGLAPRVGTVKICGWRQQRARLRLEH